MAKADLAVVKSESTALALTSMFEEDAQNGFEGMNRDDFALPFLRLLTTTSPEVSDLDNARPGMLYNSVSGILYDGKVGVQVIPCVYVRQYVEWAPRGQGTGAPVNIYPATSDILSRTHREPGDNRDYLDNGNYIENTANYYVMVLDDAGVPSPALIVMKSTQLKKARKWNSMMQAVQKVGANGRMFRPAIYSQVYRLTTVPESNDKGKWFGWEVARIGDVESAEVYEAAKTFAQSINAGDVKIKHEEDAPRSAAPADYSDVPF
jgi:hypothetical protein